MYVSIFSVLDEKTFFSSIKTASDKINDMFERMIEIATRR